MADISEKEIRHVANLAMLNLSENEIEKYTVDMKEILGYAEMINEINTDDIPETIGIAEKKNVFRKDEVHQFNQKDELLKNAPSKDEGMFNIPKVLE